MRLEEISQSEEEIKSGSEILEQEILNISSNIRDIDKLIKGLEDLLKSSNVAISPEQIRRRKNIEKLHAEKAMYEEMKSSKQKQLESISVDVSEDDKRRLYSDGPRQRYI